MYSTREAAGKLGVSIPLLQKIAARYGVQRIGRDLVWTDEDLERVRRRPRKPGRAPAVDKVPRRR